MHRLVLSFFSFFVLVSHLLITTGNGVAAPTAATSDSRDAENRAYFTDLEVTTHEGEKLRFYSDILKDKVAVLCFFYTNCPTAQPALITFFKLQKLLGEKLGRQVVLITISVDPERDSLEVLQEYARKFNPQKGWIFLTGSQENMDIINRKLGNTLKLPEGHLRFFLLGNLRDGHWMRLPDSAPVIAVADGIRSLEQSSQ